MTTRSVCIHAHFYQPPREDPVTGLIPLEAGSAPFKNWNERIHAECYRPNADLGNFEKISFNVGPTLFEWMEAHDPHTYQKILTQDQTALRRYGAGNAIAQAYNHTILPLASYQDKVTQVFWGIADFEHRFGRKPQGMWLPETAVDLETLDVLAKQGIEFTILAPWQSENDAADSSAPYRVNLPEGRSITVFFYNRELSTRVSFDPGATINADEFMRSSIVPRFNPEKEQRGQPQLVMVATDGELYGHHQKFRDRFLARLVDGTAMLNDVEITYPARWLRQHPVTRTIGIKEKTSWSCHHGVMRWAGECSCTPTNGSWKYYLRRAMDHLAYSLDQVYVEAIKPGIPDPWDLRNRYIYVMLGQTTARDLIEKMAGRRLSDETVHKVRLLLEAQRERQRAFTSCGWYFEDFGRIESKNNLAYAAQAIRLVRQSVGIDLAPALLADLKHVTSNRSGVRGDTFLSRHLERMERPIIK